MSSGNNTTFSCYLDSASLIFSTSEIFLEQGITPSWSLTETAYWSRWEVLGTANDSHHDLQGKDWVLPLQPRPSSGVPGMPC